VANKPVALSVAHPGHAGFGAAICDAAICDTAICASGTATQPLKAKAIITAKPGEKRIDWFLGRLTE
jgi:hypothetical protein